MRPRLHAGMSASGNSVEPVLLEQQIDRLFAQRLRRGLQLERQKPQLLPRLGREVDRQDVDGHGLSARLERARPEGEAGKNGGRSG